MKFFIEFGINHLGNKEILKNFSDFFCKSSFIHCTFMLHNKKFYENNPKYYIDPIFMNKIITNIKNNKKYVGLSVCDEITYNEYKTLDFDFFKLLSVGNSNYNLIDLIKKKKKYIYISTGLGNVSKSLNLFKGYKKKVILHTPMTYSSKQLNFNKINSLKKKYKLNVGYSCHNDNINTLYALSYYNPDCIFLYVKHSNMKRYKIPDDKHAVLLEDLEKIKKNYLECLNVHKINNEKFNINIFKK